jgi:hypothetical protein
MAGERLEDAIFEATAGALLPASKQPTKPAPSGAGEADETTSPMDHPLVRATLDAFKIKPVHLQEAPKGERWPEQQASVIYPCVPVWRVTFADGSKKTYIGSAMYYQIFKTWKNAKLCELLTWEYDPRTGKYVRGMAGLNDKGLPTDDLVATVWTRADFEETVLEAAPEWRA